MMRYVIISIIIALALVSCGKDPSPEGPSDIRIKNLTDLTFEELTIDTSGGTNDYNNVAPGDYSDYMRFDKAYPIAEITAVIGGQTYTTGPQNYNYQIVLGQGKFTYEVYIKGAGILEIERVIPEAPLD